ncbi:MAG: hypothetical protein OEZ43_15800 [Gammaproteobacteria bacterium]|nr:hypothetical protein [Gammaproteobacteria bacterium]
MKLIFFFVSVMISSSALAIFSQGLDEKNPIRDRPKHGIAAVNQSVLGKLSVQIELYVLPESHSFDIYTSKTACAEQATLSDHIQTVTTNHFGVLSSTIAIEQRPRSILLRSNDDGTMCIDVTS